MKFKPLAPCLAIALAAATLAGCGGGTDAGIGGTITGLTAGQTVTLQDNGVDNLVLSADGVYQFPTDLTGGSGFNVTILTQPPGEICEVANGAGQVDAAGDPVSNVAVSCVTTSSLGGSVSGLANGATLTLGNGTVLLPLSANGTFAFPGVLVQGAPYQVTVATQPVGQACTIANASGTVTATTTTAVAVTCI